MAKKSLRKTIEINPIFARPGEIISAPADRFPTDSMLPETAYQIVHDESMLDGNARLNLATFVSTWMDESANKLYSETFDKNAIDKDSKSFDAIINAFKSSIDEVFLMERTNYDVQNSLNKPKVIVLSEYLEKDEK